MGVVLRSVSKRLGSRLILDNLDLEVPSGRALAVIGPSGCGKSTLLRLVAGLLFVDQGAVSIDGKTLQPSSASSLRKDMGYVIQEGGLFPHLTIEQNILLANRSANLPPAQRKIRLAEVVELTRLATELLPRYPGELSGGQRQRVGVARALFHRPSLLLLDEPFGALDPLVRAELQQEVARLLRETHTTALLVTHDVAEAGIVADRIALLRAGKVEQHGTLAELASRPASSFVTEFLHSAKGVRDLLAPEA